MPDTVLKKPRRPRRPGLALVLLLVAGSRTGPAAAAKVATVRCVSSVSTLSWEPLPRRTIQRIVEGRVLQALTRSGRLSLLSKSASGPADLKLKVVARIIEDAQQFSVFVSATPRRLTNTGSMAAVATRPIRRMSHKQIQRQMERTADEAGLKIQRLLAPRLHLIAGSGDKLVPFKPKGPRPDWGGRLSRGGGAARRLFGRLKAGRLKALDSIRLQARKESNARLALARCALESRERELRLKCIDALAQLARRHPSAQRAIIAILVQDPPPKKLRARLGDTWKKARRRAFRVSTTFEGVAHEEAVQAWLHIFGADHADYRLMGHMREDSQLLRPIASYLKRRKAVPNLDLALARCTRMSHDGKPPNSYCLAVVKTLPPNRRVALLHRILRGFELHHDQRGEYRAWRNMLSTVSHAPLHPLIETICRERIERSFNYQDRTTCLDALGRYGKPRPALVDFIIKIFVSSKTPDSIGGVPKVAFRSVRALESLVKRKRELCGHLKRAFAPYLKSGAYPKLYKRQDYVPRALELCDRWSKEKAR